MYFFYWQLLIILFADDRAKKIMELHLFLLLERKTYFWNGGFGAFARRGHGFHTPPSPTYFQYIHLPVCQLPVHVYSGVSICRILANRFPENGNNIFMN